jgi:hypothetical protein
MFIYALHPLGIALRTLSLTSPLTGSKWQGEFMGTGSTTKLAFG